MELSVVVPTLNGRASLGDCLDALAEHVPDAEVVVVNGPSSDGTSGFVRDHRTVDLLLEVSERNLDAARNAGIAASAGDVVAFVGQSSAVKSEWRDALSDALDAGADAVTGPVHRAVEGGHTTETLRTGTFAGRQVTFFDGGNVAFTRGALDDLDGFDEYLDAGGAADAAHRLAGLDRHMEWRPAFAVVRAEGARVADRISGRSDAPAWGLEYRALAYRLAKNYGARPTVVAHGLRRAAGDALAVFKQVLRGEATPSAWTSNGRAVLANIVAGTEDGLRARAADASPRRNPNGVSTRMDRAVSRFEP